MHNEVNRGKIRFNKINHLVHLFFNTVCGAKEEMPLTVRSKSSGGGGGIF